MANISLSFEQVYHLLDEPDGDFGTMDVAFCGVETIAEEEYAKFAGRMHKEKPEPSEIYIFSLRNGSYRIDSDCRTIIPYQLQLVRINIGLRAEEKKEYLFLLERLRGLNL